MAIAAIFLLLFGATFLITGLMMFKAGKDFSNNSTSGFAVVSGYETSDNSSHLGIRVDIVGINSKTSVLCQSQGIKNCSDFPIGKKVKVKYLEKSFLGVKYYDVRLEEDGFKPINRLKLGKILTILGAVLLAIAACIGLLYGGAFIVYFGITKFIDFLKQIDFGSM